MLDSSTPKTNSHCQKTQRAPNRVEGVVARRAFDEHVYSQTIFSTQ